MKCPYPLVCDNSKCVLNKLGCGKCEYKPNDCDSHNVNVRECHGHRVWCRVKREWWEEQL